MSKVCNICKIEQSLDCFYSDKRNRDGKRGQCKTCCGRTTAKWQARNYDRVLAASRRWKEAHPDKVRAYSAMYWDTHKEERKAALRAWFASNPGMNTFYCRQRENRKRGAKGSHTREQLKARIDFYNGRCYLCGELADTIDHVIPIACGGSEWPANLRPACRSCNSRKGKKSLLDIGGLF